MGKIHERLDDRLNRIHHETTPLLRRYGPGHPGRSPQRLPQAVAHLRQNGRITILFCTFEARAEIGSKNESGGDAVGVFENP